QTPKTKNQAPNTKEIPSSKLQTAARASSLELGAWSFFGVWCLVFGVWCLVFRFRDFSGAWRWGFGVSFVNYFGSAAGGFVAVPEPAPNRASVAPPPNATPAPASFLGNWISTSKIRNRQSSTRMTVNRPIVKLIIIVLSVHAVFDDVRKAAVFQRRAAHQCAI